MSGPCIDLFAGPGGIDLAATELGLDVLGIELDDDACATRQAVGLRTLQADVAALDPADFAPCWGLMGSPPCPTFSNAGNGCGRQVIDVILVCARELVAGRDTRPASIDEARLILEPICWAQEQAAAAKKGRDPDRVKSDAHASRDAAMSLLVVEPLRWALALRPRWIALEQVPPVLPIWEAIARMLRDQDYETWTGLLSAERFGVPQTRERAFLLASLDGVVVPPRPTHQRYIAPRRKDDDEAVVGLFDEPPGRIVHREDRDLLPWVSMEDALGFGMTARPMTTLAPGTASGGPDAVGARRGVDEPAPTITGAHDHGERRWLRTGNFTAVARDDDGKRTAGGSVPYERESSEPAPTVGCGGPGEWVHGERPWLRAGTNAHDTARPADEPVPTLRFGPRLNDVSWVGERPSTTVAGDPRVHPPGHKVNGEDVAAGRDGYEGRAGLNAVRVSLAEALVLQSFPPDYPVQGTKTAQFRQVGNAVPPLFAWHVLRAVIPAAESEAS